MHLENGGQRIEDDEDRQTERELARPPFADKAIDIVKHDGKQRNINDVVE